MEKTIYAKFSNDRDYKFNICTSISIDDNGNYHVYKKSTNDDSSQHIRCMYDNYNKLQRVLAGSDFSLNKCLSFDGDAVELEYIKGKTMEEELDHSRHLDKDGSHFLANIKWFADTFRHMASLDFCISESFERVFGKCKLNGQHKSMPITDIDLIFPNFILTDDGDSEQSDDGLLGKGTYNILDYEWTFDFPIPIDYVIYRALYFYSIGERGDKIAKLTGGIDIWEYVGIDSVSCAIYSEMESNFQKYVAGNNIPLWSLYQDVGGNLIGVKDAFSYELKMANAKRLEIISDDEVIYKTIAMTTLNGEYIASLPTFDRTSTQVIIPVGPCEYQIGGVYYINDDNQIVGLDYIASGHKNKKGRYVTGENYIRIEVDKIPEGLPSFLINYTIACEDKNMIIDDIVQEAELEAEIERTQELIEEGKKKIQELTERLMENN